MTREDAIYLLNCIVTNNPYDKEAIQLAIQALQWKQKLTKQLQTLEKFNNNDVPQWVWNVIKGL